MTYSRLVRRYQPARPPMAGLAGVFTQIQEQLTGKGSSTESQCVAQGNAQVASLDAKIDDLVTNWHPTGYYTPEDIRRLVNATLTVVNQAGNAVAKAAEDTTASGDSLVRASRDLGDHGKLALDYLQAARDAEAQGLQYVNADGIKRWVTDTMAAASSALVTVAAIACIKPWWVDALAAYQRVFDAAYNVVSRVVGAVIAIGETVLKVADDLPELYDYLKWGALAFAAYWGYTHIRDRR